MQDQSCTHPEYGEIDCHDHQREQPGNKGDPTGDVRPNESSHRRGQECHERQPSRDRVEDHRSCQIVDGVALRNREWDIVDACENTDGVVANHSVRTSLAANAPVSPEKCEKRLVID